MTSEYGTVLGGWGCFLCSTVFRELIKMGSDETKLGLFILSFGSLLFRWCFVLFVCFY
jgi:hypothetical protein